MSREHVPCWGQNVSGPITGFKLSFDDAVRITNPAPSHIVSLILTACPLITPFPLLTHPLHKIIPSSSWMIIGTKPIECKHPFTCLSLIPFLFYVITLYICIVQLVQGLYSACQYITRGTVMLSHSSKRCEIGLNATISVAIFFFFCSRCWQMIINTNSKTRMLKTGTKPI